MTGFNMPPGVSPSDIPGNSPEDAAIEAAEIALMQHLDAAGFSPREYELLGTIAIPIIEAAREYAAKFAEDAVADALQDRMDER